MSEQPEPKPEGQPAVKELTGRIGKYDILKPLGKGAMGMVYLAHDTILERDVALKVMVAQIADDPELKKRFEREAKAVARMTHPNVVNVFDLGNHSDGSPFIAMELLKGMDLQKAMRTPPPLTLERKINFIIQVLAGLAHAHQAGIVHRDIKPANIFINHDGTVKIMDFGVARLTSASMTGTGNIVGTADYMSPEQVKGAHVDGRSDVFSVGCMLYELLAAKRPFHSENLMAIFYKITHDEPNWDLIPGGEEYDSLLPILRKALAKDLEQRYQSAYDFAIDLREYLKGHAASNSGESGLEGLVDLEPPPTVPPSADTEAPLATLVTEGEEHPGGATMDLGPTSVQGKTVMGRGTGTLKGGAATVVGGRTGTVRGQAPTVVGGAPTRVAPGAARPSPQARPTPRPEPQGNPMLYSVLGAMVVLLVGAGGYIYLTRNKVDKAEPPPVTQASMPPVSAAPVTAPPATQAPTAAPPPTFAEAVGKSAAAMKSAQSAFKSGDYDRAVAQAQVALKEDPGNADAQKILGNAVEGQKAAGHFRSADAALARNDFATATTEAEAGRAAAPWDSRGPNLLSKIQDAQQRAASQAQQQAQQQAAQATTKQVNEFLSKADGALSDQKYDVAISMYDEALKIDPQNQRAIMGKSSSVQARALSQAASGGGGRATGGGKGFVSGKTAATSAEIKAGGAVPEGFEETAGVTVKKGTQAAELPGKVNFDIDPDAVKPGDKYTVKVNFVNEGTAPIQIKDLVVTTTVNGRKVSGPVPSLVKDVAPQQKAVLLSLPDFWKEDTTSWSMEVTVRTSRGETYKNQIAWR